MEKQSDLEISPAQRGQQDAEPIVRNPWWVQMGERVAGGFVYSSRGEKIFYLNPFLRQLPGMTGAESWIEDQFWVELCGLTIDPGGVKRQIERALEQIGDMPIIEIPLGLKDRAFSTLHFFPLSGSSGTVGEYGVIFSAGRSRDPGINQIVKVYTDISSQARQTVGAAQGTLQALRGNLQAWSPDVLDKFLGDAEEQVEQIRHSLDLVLSYSSMASQFPLFVEPTPLRDPLQLIIKENQYRISIKRENLEGMGAKDLVKIDRALLRISLESLLKKITDDLAPGQQLEAVISRAENFVILTLESPGTLPLPGLDLDTGTDRGLHEKPGLLLVQQMIAAQGGKLILAAGQKNGAGMNIQVYLPAAGSFSPETLLHDGLKKTEQRTGRILVAEVQPEYQLRIQEMLTEIGFRVDLAVDGSAVLDMVQVRNPDLVILDRNLPGMDGLLVTQGIRRWSSVPIIMVSDRDNMDDLLYAYRLGVDDYLQKPFLIGELIAKVEVFLSRAMNSASVISPEIYQEGSIRIDQSSRQVWVRGNPIQLTPIEYNLLVYLSSQGRQIIPYEQMLEQVWEGPEKGSRQGLFVHVRRLREKLELDPKHPKILKNKWGVGYVFNP